MEVKGVTLWPNEKFSEKSQRQKKTVGLFHNYWENSHQFPKTKKYQRGHPQDSEKRFSTEKTSKNEKLSKKVYQNIFHLKNSSVNRIVAKKPKVAPMLAKRFVAAKIKGGHFDWNTLEKSIVQKEHKGGPFGLPFFASRIFFWFSARLEPTHFCISGLRKSAVTSLSSGN